MNHSDLPGIRDIIKRSIEHISKLQNFQVDEATGKQAPSVRIQMYEFFFSNSLIKAMQVPFMEDTYMIGFFER
jgi:hypothetical protein